ncbi:hypothetical protein OAR33_00305 [bacterium]|nr:hypothetical protein [bacterium]
MSNYGESMPVIGDCLFEENTAGDHGGAISNACFSDAVVSDSRFVNNQAAFFGGAILNSAFGPGTCGSSPEILRCEFEGNYADEGGAVANQNQSNPLILACVFRANLAAKGGAVASHECHPTIRETEFMGNRATNWGGGLYGNYLNFPGSHVIEDCSFSGNLSDNSGGAICLRDPEAFIGGCLFQSNIAIGGGGALLVPSSASAVQIESCDFIQNEAAGGGGASVSSSPGGSVSFFDCSFRQNRAMNGGGMAVIVGNTVLHECFFFENDSSGVGGATYVDEDVAFEAFDCEWAMNSATDGGAILSYTNAMRLDRCVVAGNVSTAGAGGIEIRSAGKVELAQSTICGNSAPQILGLIEGDEGNCVETVCDDCDLRSDPCPTDLDQNGITDGGDLGAFFIFWGECQVEDCLADFNGDEVVDGIDLGILFSAWGPCQ